MRASVIEVKVKALERNGQKAVAPQYATRGSVGCDLSAFIDEDVIIPPLGFKVIGTGVCIELPEGFEAQVRGRSGLAAKEGVFLLNTPGTIDSDYRGEIKVILANYSEKDFVVKNGMRIAQMVFNEVPPVSFVHVDFLTLTDRNEKGLGSTGTERLDEPRYVNGKGQALGTLASHFIGIDVIREEWEKARRDKKKLMEAMSLGLKLRKKLSWIDYQTKNGNKRE